MQNGLEQFNQWLENTFDELANSCLGIIVIVAITTGLLVGLILGTAFVVSLFVHPGTPTIFCRSGTEIRTTPATRVIGKSTYEGVDVSCP